MLKKHFTITIFLISIFFLLTSCTSEISTVELNNQSTIFDIETFTVEKLELKISYENSSDYRIIKVNKSMISKEDLMKLQNIGTHTITIKYNDFNLQNIQITLEKNTNLIIEEIKLNVDDANYQIESLSNKYTATCTHDFQYRYIIIKVVLNDDYTFSNNGILLYINDKLIDSSLYTISDKTLNYTYLDPYWSDIF